MLSCSCAGPTGPPPHSLCAQKYGQIDFLFLNAGELAAGPCRSRHSCQLIGWAPACGQPINHDCCPHPSAPAGRGYGQEIFPPAVNTSTYYECDLLGMLQVPGWHRAAACRCRPCVRTRLSVQRAVVALPGPPAGDHGHQPVGHGPLPGGGNPAAGPRRCGPRMQPAASAAGMWGALKRRRARPPVSPLQHTLWPPPLSTRWCPSKAPLATPPARCGGAGCGRAAACRLCHPRCRAAPRLRLSRLPRTCCLQRGVTALAEEWMVGADCPPLNGRGRARAGQDRTVHVPTACSCPYSPYHCTLPRYAVQDEHHPNMTQLLSTIFPGWVRADSSRLLGAARGSTWPAGASSPTLTCPMPCSNVKTNIGRNSILSSERTRG